MECKREGRPGRTPTRPGVCRRSRFVYRTARHRHRLDCSLQEVLPHGQATFTAFTPRPHEPAGLHAAGTEPRQAEGFHLSNPSFVSRAEVLTDRAANSTPRPC